MIKAAIGRITINPIENLTFVRSAAMYPDYSFAGNQAERNLYTSSEMILALPPRA